jgi:acetyltransferase
MEALHRIFNPSSVAIVGASDKRRSIGSALVENLIQGGYGGRVFAVNPRHSSVHGLPSYASILDIHAPVDLALIAIPMGLVPAVIRECGQAGVTGAVVFSAGGKEVGEGGRDLEAAILEAAIQGHVRIIGPNCMGLVSVAGRLNASFAGPMPLSGKLAFVSQSGAMCSAILDFSRKEGIGFSYFVSIGSMVDVDFGDLIDYLGYDGNVNSIALYVENLTNVRKFMSAARAVSRAKPIVVLKAGRSKAGARAACSHTGALAGEDAVYDAAFKRAGLVRVDTVQELFDCAELMAKQPIPRGPGLAVVTNGGGPGVMTADALSDRGLEPVPLSAETKRRLDSVLPGYWSGGNPIDILGDASPERWRDTLEVCLAAREIHALVVIFVPQNVTGAKAAADVLVELAGRKPAMPVFAVWMGGGGVEAGRHVLNKAGIPTYDTPERAVSAFVHMYSYARNLETLQAIPPRLPRALQFDHKTAEEMIRPPWKDGRVNLTEVESKNLLAAYGIPANRTEAAVSAHEAVSFAQDIGYPVVMKVLSRDIVHKSDVCGVQLELCGKRDVERAFARIMKSACAHHPEAQILGVTVQKMLDRPDYELIAGSKKDPDFGPVIVFGMGGIITEIVRDRAIALPPLNRLLARRVMEETKIYRMMTGYRNRPTAPLGLLEEILVRLSQLVADFPEIVELDINPVIIVGDRAFAADARVVLEPSRVMPPDHLVISPYPNQYEMRATSKKGMEFSVRPIKPEDAPLLLDLFGVLSPQSIYYRFLQRLKTLPRKMLATLTQIDYGRDMALVAMDDRQAEERMLGVARLIRDPGGSSAEFAVLVGDPWQGQGIGAVLMSRLLAIAKERGLKSLWGLALAENTTMLALGRKAGFTVSRSDEDNAFKLEIRLA